MPNEQERKRALAERIKNGREALDINTVNFAHMIGVSKSTLYRYENGECVPDALTMELIDGILSNLQYHQDAYVPLDRMQQLLQEMSASSKALRLIKSMLFSAALEHRPSIAYEGLLTKRELKFLFHFGYRIEKKGAVYIIYGWEDDRGKA